MTDIDIPSSLTTVVSVEIKDSSELGISLPDYLPAPDLYAPLANQAFRGVTSIDFEWEEVVGAEGYEWQISESTDFWLWETKSHRTVGEESTEIKVGSEGIIYPLKNDVSLYWRVRALRGFLSSVWSEVRSFRIIPPEPEERPAPPWIQDLITDHDEVKPVMNGFSPDLHTASITVELAAQAGPVESYNWSLSGPGSLTSQTASGAVFNAPTIAQMASYDNKTQQQIIDMVCNTGPGRTCVIRFSARNTGGATSQKVDVNVRLQACDVIDTPDKPTQIGSTYYEEEE